MANINERSTAPGITLFSVPKPFKGQIEIIQRNAIRSWLKLSPRSEIILFGKDAGVEEISREYDLRYIPELEKNGFGTPLIDSIFELAQAAASNELMAYINTDIILFDDFPRVVSRIPENIGDFLITGRRWDLKVWGSLDFGGSRWDSRLRKLVRERGMLHSSTGVDYYLFRRGLYKHLKPFALGRTYWDNWLLWYARHRGACLIDATTAVTAIHQEHDYNHVSGGALKIWNGEEAARNRELAGSDLVFVSQADFGFEQGGLIPYSRYKAPEDPSPERRARIKIAQAKEALNRGFGDECRDVLAFVESLFPDEPRNLCYLKARLAETEGDSETAVGCLKKELEKYPDNREASVFLQSLETEGGKIDRITWDMLRQRRTIRLYAGDIFNPELYGDAVGLSINQMDERHLFHDITEPIPLADESVDSFQAEDVFEHIPFEMLMPVIDEIYRILIPGGLFRLSLPDYGCDLLQERSVKDEHGRLMFDPGGGGTPENPGHLWFPEFDMVQALLEKTRFASEGSIEYLHYYNSDGSFVMKPVDYSNGHVSRTPDFDSRVQNPPRPMSMIIDLRKGGRRRNNV
jgi:predicted SAM-dependent methyltransferase